MYHHYVERKTCVVEYIYIYIYHVKRLSNIDLYCLARLFPRPAVLTDFF